MLNDLRDTFGYKIPELFPKFKDPSNLVKSCPLEFWFDGKDASTFILNGVNVIQWDDKSGHGRHLLNAVDAQRPSYDAATGRVDFVAANSDYLQSAGFGPLAQPNTIFIVYQSSTWGYVFDGLVNYCAIRFYDTFQMYSGVVLIDGVSNLNDNIHCAEFNGVNSNYWINGVFKIIGDAGAFALDGITLGARKDLLGDFSSCEIMEVFGYNCIITTAERNALTAYLTSKWSL